MDIELVLRTPKHLDSTDIDALTQRAEQGDRAALKELRALVRDEPAIWQQLGNSSKHLEKLWTEKLARDNPLLTESIKKYVDELRKEIEGPDPTPLEGLLVDRIVVCWLEVHQSEWQLATATDVTTAHISYLDRRLDRAQRRYLQAIKALAQVRKLLGSTTQINIAEQQINIAG